MSAEIKSSLATRPSLLARLKDWSQQTAWREFDGLRGDCRFDNLLKTLWRTR